MSVPRYTHQLQNPTSRPRRLTSKAIHSLAALTLVIAAGCSGGSGGSPAVPIAATELTGTWSFDFKTASASSACARDVGNEHNMTGTMIYDPLSKGIMISTGPVLATATYSDNTLRVKISYDEEGGRVNSEVTIVFSSNTEGTGTEKWIWSKGSTACSGTDAITCRKISSSTIDSAPDPRINLMMITIDENGGSRVDYGVSNAK